MVTTCAPRAPFGKSAAANQSSTTLDAHPGSGQPGKQRHIPDRVDRREERSEILANLDQKRRHRSYFLLHLPVFPLPSCFLLPCALRFRRNLITVAIRANERTSTLGLSEKFSLLFRREGGNDFLEVRVPAQWVP